MRSRLIPAAFLLLAVGSAARAQSSQRAPADSSAVDDEPWAGEIAEFIKADRVKFPKPGGVVFVGSSTIRMWPNLARDFPGVNVIQRGFGGSELSDVVYRAPRIVLPYKPRLIVLYAGDNDLANGRTPQDVLKAFQSFVAVVRAALPQTRIAFVSIKPSWARVSLLDKMKATNSLVREYIAGEQGLIYVDAFSRMLSPAGHPRAELLESDSLHMNATGYKLWRYLLTPVVRGKRPESPASAASASPASRTSPAPQLTADELAKRRAAQDEKLRTDWADLQKYRAANAQLSPMTDENRVVFMGNSITEGWARYFPAMFPGKPYIGRGISGQTTPQMLVRFRQDVVSLKPRVVVILAGTNDIAGNTGPSTPEMIEDNIASMAEIARANGIRVVLSSILPVYDYPWKPGLQPAQTIIAINKWMKSWAEQHGEVYLDYHSAMADERGGMRDGLASDGVHPTEAGYRVMAPLAERAISEALRPR